MIATYLCGNRLLDARPNRDRERTAAGMHGPHVEPRDFAHGAETVRSRRLPTDAVLSVFANFVNGDVCEVGTVGCEGFLEAEAALEVDTARRPSSCQVAGRVVRMPIETFRQELRFSAPFARIVRRNVSARLFRPNSSPRATSSTCCSNGARAASHDARPGGPRRVRAQPHDVLATMLGVASCQRGRSPRRPCNSGAQSDTGRGIVVVTDADLLSAAACECYETSKHAFERSLRDDDVAVDEELHTVLRG